MLNNKICNSRHGFVPVVLHQNSADGIGRYHP